MGKRTRSIEVAQRDITQLQQEIAMLSGAGELSPHVISPLGKESSPGFFPRTSSGSEKFLERSRSRSSDDGPRTPDTSSSKNNSQMSSVTKQRRKSGGSKSSSRGRERSNSGGKKSSSSGRRSRDKQAQP